MPGKILISLFGVVTLVGCATERLDIQAICSRDQIGNYIIKWETEPLVDGSLKVFVSKDPNDFDRTKPALFANAQDGIATYITNDNVTRNYFLLSFNDKYTKIVGSRGVSMDRIQNLRDMGGYPASHHKTTRWGMVYRSGTIANRSEWDSVRLSKLGIKTIIDLRDNEEFALKPTQFEDVKVFRFSVSVENLNEIPMRIREGRMRKGDVILFMQDQYIKYITENKKTFAAALELFQNKENYPILFNCSLGKDRAGFLAAMLLAALGVPEEEITKDYTTSNDYIDVSFLSYLAEGLSWEAQEAITILISAQEAFIAPTLQKIEKDHGSIEKFLSKELGVSEKERENLKEILLY